NVEPVIKFEGTDLLVRNDVGSQKLDLLRLVIRTIEKIIKCCLDTSTDLLCVEHRPVLTKLHGGFLVDVRDAELLHNIFNVEQGRADKLATQFLVDVLFM